MAVRDIVQAAAGAAGGGIPWDISTAVYNGTPLNSFSVLNRENSPMGLFFKPDGTTMYIVGTQNDSVQQYNLPSAWNIANAVYIQSFSVSAQDTIPRDLFFKDDGTKMYILGDSGNDVNEYDLSTAWDISTSSYVQNLVISARGETAPQGLFFRSNGTRMWIVGSAYDHVTQYNLSSAWDISTAVYDRELNISSYEGSAQGLFFKPDGAKMWVVGTGGGSKIHEWNLPIAWDLDGASYVQSYTLPTINSANPSPYSIFFKSDGTEWYGVFANAPMYQFQLSTIWDVTTTSYSTPTTDYFSIATEESTSAGLFFKYDGTKMYVVGTNGDDVNEYSLSTAWDITSASYVQNFSVVTQDTVPRAVFFKPDGTKMYVLGSTGDDVNEYGLSVAWDISTASYIQNFSVASEETTPQGLFFKDDGTKMYVTGNSGDDVNEYTLGTAWNISTASYVQNFSVSAQDNSPSGIFFKPDGTKMYIVGTGSDNVNEYDLSTAWDVSSASYLQSFYVASQDLNPVGLFFKDDGTKMYIVGSESDAVWSFDL